MAKQPSKHHGGAAVMDEPETPRRVAPASEGAQANMGGEGDATVEAEALEGSGTLPEPPPGTTLPAPLAAGPLPPLGFTPTSVNQIILNVGQKPTYFAGPLVSGFPTINAQTAT